MLFLQIIYFDVTIKFSNDQFSLMISLSQSKNEIRVPCPFDKNHLILAQKLLNHINKCKSPTRRDYTVCPFNPYHWVNYVQLSLHQLSCPNNPNNNNLNLSRKSFNNYQLAKKKIEMENEKEKQKISIDFQKINFKMENMNNPRDKKWAEPNFQEWFQMNYKRVKPQKMHMTQYDLSEW